MSYRLLENPPKRGVCLLLIFVFSVILYMTNLGGWDLWPSDEPRFGQIEREMLKTGEWIVPHVNAEVYTDKPPLFFWAGNVAALLLNDGPVSSFTTRLPSALSGIALLLVTFFLGEQLFNRRAALLGTLALAVAAKYVIQARTAQTDIIMVVFAVWALAVYGHVRFGNMRNWPGAICFGLFTGLAVLGKGPVGIVVPIGSIALYLTLAKEWRRVRWGVSAFAFGLCLVVVFAWLLPMLLATSDAAGQDLLWDQNVTRYLAATHHKQPIWYFLERLPLGFLPMTLLLPATLAALWREKRETGKPFSRKRLFLFSWIVFTFVFFSLSPGKREQYILPLYPALALLVGDWMDRHLLRSPSAGGFVTWSSRFIGFLLTVVGSVMLFAGGAIYQRIAGHISDGEVPQLWFSFAAIGAGLALSGLVVLAGTRERRLTNVFGGLVVGTLVAWLTACLFVFPPLNQRKSGRFLCEAINREWSPGEKVFSYDIYRSQYHLWGDYYLDEVDKPDPIVEAFRRDEQVFCLLRSDEYEEMRDALGETPSYVLWEDPVGHRAMTVISNQPPQQQQAP